MTNDTAAKNDAAYAIALVTARLDQTAVDAEYAAHLARDPEFVPVDDDDYRLSVNDEEPVY